MFKMFLYQPKPGGGHVGGPRMLKRIVNSEAAADGMMADAKASWKDKLVEVKDDFLMNANGDWLMKVAMAA